MLAATALGGLLAAGGGFLGVWWSEKRTAEREERQRHWAREDRNFEDLREACLHFRGLYYRVRNELSSAEDEARVADLPEDWSEELDEASERLYIYGSVALTEAASRAHSTLLRAWMRQEFIGPLTREQVEERNDPRWAFDGSGIDLTAVIRTELGVPPQDWEAYLKTWAPEDPGKRYVDQFAPGELQKWFERKDAAEAAEK